MTPDHPPHDGRDARGPNRPHERGAVLVESAVILPLVLLLTFGIVEFSYVYFSSSFAGEATRKAATVGSQLGQQAAYWEDVEEVAAWEIRKLPDTATPINLWIYRANDRGYPGPGDNDDFGWDTFVDCYAGAPNANSCMIRQWDPESQTFGAGDLGFLGAPWNPGTHEICGDDVDRIGVAVTYTYHPILEMFDPILRSDVESPSYSQTVLTFEPGISAVCN